MSVRLRPCSQPAGVLDDADRVHAVARPDLPDRAGQVVADRPRDRCRPTAISATDDPREASERTLSSRAVSGISEARSSATVSRSSRKRSPLATMCTASISRRAGASLSRNPSTPASKALRNTPGRSGVARTTSRVPHRPQKDARATSSRGPSRQCPSTTHTSTGKSWSSGSSQRAGMDDTSSPSADRSSCTNADRSSAASCTTRTRTMCNPLPSPIVPTDHRARPPVPKPSAPGRPREAHSSVGRGRSDANTPFWTPGTRPLAVGAQAGTRPSRTGAP